MHLLHTVIDHFGTSTKADGHVQVMKEVTIQSEVLQLMKRSGQDTSTTDTLVCFTNSLEVLLQHNGTEWIPIALYIMRQLVKAKYVVGISLSCFLCLKNIYI